MPRFERKSFERPDETHTFDKGRGEVIRFEETTAVRMTLQPGWRWSEHAGADSCGMCHVGYVMTGALHVRLDDGTEGDIVAGQAYVIPPGHDGWVTGDEPTTLLELGPDAADRFGERGRP